MVKVSSFFIGFICTGLMMALFLIWVFITWTIANSISPYYATHISVCVSIVMFWGGLFNVILKEKERK